MIPSAPETAEREPIEEQLPMEEYHSREGIREYYDLKDDIEMNTREGETELLERMREKHPDLNGRLDEAHEYVSRLYRQHQVWDEMKEETRPEDLESFSDEEATPDDLESVADEEAKLELNERERALGKKERKLRRKISKAQMDKQKSFFERNPILSTTAIALLLYFYGPKLMQMGFSAIENIFAGTSIANIVERIRALLPLGGGTSSVAPNLPVSPDMA